MRLFHTVRFSHKAKCSWFGEQYSDPRLHCIFPSPSIHLKALLTVLWIRIYENPNPQSFLLFCAASSVNCSTMQGLEVHTPRGRTQQASVRDALLQKRHCNLVTESRFERQQNCRSQKSCHEEPPVLESTGVNPLPRKKKSLRGLLKFFLSLLAAMIKLFRGLWELRHRTVKAEVLVTNIRSREWRTLRWSRAVFF